MVKIENKIKLTNILINKKVKINFPMWIVRLGNGCE